MPESWCGGEKDKAGQGGGREESAKKKTPAQYRKVGKAIACTVPESWCGGGKGQNGIWRRWRGQEKRRRSAEIRTKAAEQGGEKGEKTDKQGERGAEKFCQNTNLLQIYYNFYKCIIHLPFTMEG